MKHTRRLPNLPDMVQDLNATPGQLAAYLGVSKSTIYRWLNVGTAPQSAMLAIYWQTSWGLSEIDADMHNRANVYQWLAQALERELGVISVSVQRVPLSDRW